MDRHNGDQEHCVDQRCERLQWENFYLRTQLEQILQELRQVGHSDPSNFHKPLLLSTSSPTSTTTTTVRLQQQLSKTSISSTTSSCRLSQNYNCATTDEASSSSSAGATYRNQNHQQQRSEVVGRRLRVLEEELAAFKKDLSNMQRRHTSDEATETTMVGVGSGSAPRYLENSCTIGGGIAPKSDQEIQTSPSEAPSIWPPPAVHGSPRRRPQTVRARELPASTSGVSKIKRQLPKSEIAHWVASRPGCRLARAKYSYKPLRDSPNDNPELELSLEPGDYVLLYGDMDEDYFYHGELFDGEQGLVPSNYVEIVPEEELAVSASQLQPAIRAPLTVTPLRNSLVLSSNSLSGTRVFAEKHNGQPSRFSRGLFTNNAGDYSTTATATNIKDFSQKQNESLLGSSLPDSVCPYPAVDVSSVIVHEVRQPEGARVPCPRELLVERQLAKSVLISWSPPDNPLVPVAHYHVCIDGVVRAVIPGGYKTKALIEDVDSQKNHRISVRAVTDTGQSPDAACSVTIGKDANVAPQDLKISNLTPISAQVLWYPSNSNCEHMVLLNGLKVGTCPPGVSQVQLKGLIPSTMYRCAIRVKDPKAVLEEKPVESYTDFKTLPKIGLPDPPQNVQCELGPQDGTLLITWQPVTSQPKPPSRAAISGYLVYADGKKLTEVDSPTGDHVLLRCSDLADDPPLFITVKAKTREGMVSSDSNVVRVPRIGGGGIEGLKIATAIQQPTTVAGPSTLPTVVNVTPTSPIQLVTQQQPAPSSAPTAGGLLMIQQSPQVSSGGTAVVPHPYHNAPGPLPAGIALGAGGPAVLTAGTPYALVAAGNTNAAALTGAFTRQLIANQNAASGAPTASYYVFHPHLSQIEPSTMEKPSLLEMENNYLVRHQQQRRRGVFGGRRSYSLNDEEHIQPAILPYGSPVLIHKRQQPSGVPRIHITGASGSEGAPSIIGYSDEDWDYSQGRPPTTVQRPLMARYRRKLRQVDSRALSEPDLRLDPRAVGIRQKNRPRYVVALYDYNPRHMSPNPNGAHEELSFRKGQTILVYTEKDADGFYRGELNGRVGLVPSNLVVETDQESHYMMQRSDQSPSYSETPEYPATYLKRLPQPSAFMHPAEMRSHQMPESYYHRRAYIPSDLERWGNSSDPSLARTRGVEYEYEPPPASTVVDRDRYAAAAAGPAHDDPRHRRSKFKQQSRSLDYDLDREEYHDRGPERDRAYDNGKYPSRPYRDTVGGYGHPPTKPLDKSRGRSVDRYDREPPYQGEYDEYNQRYRRDYPEPEMNRDFRAERPYRGPGPPPPNQQPPEYYGSLSRHPARYRDQREREEYETHPSGPPPPHGGRGDLRYSNQMAFRNNRMGYSEPTYSTSSRSRDPRVTSSSRYEDLPPSGAYPPEKDRDRDRDRDREPGGGYSSSGRKLPHGRPEDERDLRRFGSGGGEPMMRRSGRDGLEQSISEHVRNIPPRRLTAQFDYDPKENSPNPGAEQEELTFRAGDVITVYGDVDEDGFFVGELNGRRGLVPSNFLTMEPSSADVQAQFSMGGSTETPPEMTSMSRSRKELGGGVSFSTDDRQAVTMDGSVPVDRQSRQPSSAQSSGAKSASGSVPSSAQKPQPAAGGPVKQPPAGAGGKAPGQLKKTDSTVGNKTPPKKVSVAQGPAAPTSRKTSVAVKPGGGGKS